MYKIYKYPVKLGTFQITMPVGAKILSCQTQKGYSYMWCLIDTSKQDKIYTFRTYGTGHDIEDNNLEYIGTFQTGNETFVWHLFQEV